MDSKEFRRAAHASIDQIIDYYETIQEKRVLSNVEPGYLRQLLPTAAPEKGEPWDTIQADIEKTIMPGITHWQSPNFFAFYPASSTWPGILGDLFSGALTAPAFNWQCSPAVTELETIVLDWLAKLLALPSTFQSSGTGGGVIQGTASEATLVAMVAARERYLERATINLVGEEKIQRKAELMSRLVALGSDQSHSSAPKGARIAGVRYRYIPTRPEDGFALTGKALQAALDSCIADGLEPFFVFTTLGTTNTCAVEDFPSIAATLKDKPEIWVHVDAAYAGAALVCPEYQHLTKPFEQFNSFDVNMHKWLLTNFDASCLFVRNRRDLTNALSITPEYLRNEHSESGLVTDYRDWSIPLGRRFRALKIWFVLRTYGAEGLRKHIREHVRMGMLFHDLVKARDDLFTIVAPPAFALTVFSIRSLSKVTSSRVTESSEATSDTKLAPDSDIAQPSLSNALSDGLVEPPAPKYNAVLVTQVNGTAASSTLEASNDLTRRVYDLVNSRGEIFITSTVVNGVYAIRIVSANPKAEEKFVRRAFDIIVATTEELRRSAG